MKNVPEQNNNQDIFADFIYKYLVDVKKLQEEEKTGTEVDYNSLKSNIENDLDIILRSPENYDLTSKKAIYDKMQVILLFNPPESNKLNSIMMENILDNISIDTIKNLRNIFDDLSQEHQKKENKIGNNPDNNNNVANVPTESVDNHENQPSKQLSGDEADQISKIEKIYGILDTRDKEYALNYIVYEMLKFSNPKEASEYVEKVSKSYPIVKKSFVDISTKYLGIINDKNTIVDMINDDKKDEAVKYIVNKTNLYDDQSFSYQYLDYLMTNNEIRNLQNTILQEYMFSQQEKANIAQTEVVSSKSTQEQDIEQVLEILNNRDKDSAINYIVNKMFSYRDDKGRHHDEAKASKYMMSLFADETIRSTLMHDIIRPYTKLVQADKQLQQEQSLRYSKKEDDIKTWQKEYMILKEIEKVSQILKLKGKNEASVYIADKMLRFHTKNKDHDKEKAFEYLDNISKKNIGEISGMIDQIMKKYPEIKGMRDSIMEEYPQIKEMRDSIMEKYDDLYKKYNHPIKDFDYLSPNYKKSTTQTIGKKSPTYKSDINTILDVLKNKGKDAAIDYVIEQGGKDDKKLDEYVYKIKQDFGKISKQDRDQLTKLYSDVIAKKQAPESTKFQDKIKAEKPNTKPRSNSI